MLFTKIGIMLSFIPFVFSFQTLLFNETNLFVIRGPITETLADDFVKSMIIDKPEYIYIYSNGGSVIAGNRIVMQLINKNVTCVAERAYSMAFVILQACKHRYITPTATAMQHQQSIGHLSGDLASISGYLNMVHAMEQYLTEMQSTRIGISEEKLRTLSSVEWWMFGEDIIYHNVADEIVQVDCTIELVKKNTTVVKRSFFGDVTEIYSGCPLLHTPISEIDNDNTCTNAKLK